VPKSHAALVGKVFANPETIMKDERSIKDFLYAIDIIGFGSLDADQK
jgi:hypothetical protein